MKRRSKAGREPIKGRRRKTPEPKRRDAPKASAAFNASSAVEDTKVARLTHELREAVEQQSATSEVLRVISSYPGDPQPIFQAMLRNAVRLCDAEFGNIYRWDGEALNLVATQNAPPAFAEARRLTTGRPGSKTPTGRMIANKKVVHIADLRAEKAYADRDPWIVAGVELGGVRTVLMVPMLKENELIGAFSVYRQEVRSFTDRQITLGQNFAAQAVIAIENAADGRMRIRPIWGTPTFLGVSRRRIVYRHQTQSFANPKIDISEFGFADAGGALKHRREHWLKIAGGPADDLKSLRRGRLVL
jgi:hypothetical protein